MNYYITGALMSFLLFGLGCAMLILGIWNFLLNKDSKSDRLMFWLCIFGFLLEFGYAWMGLCYNSDFAYAARAVGLISDFLYIIFYMEYTACIGNFSKKITGAVVFVVIVLLAASCPELISHNAVSFTMTPWGWWYVGRMTRGRLIETVSTVIAAVFVVIVLVYGQKHSTSKRQKYVLKNLMLYPVLAVSCFLIDTFIPSLFNTSAIPCTCIGFAAGTLWSFYIAEKNRLLGLSKETVSKYVFDDVKIPVIVTDKDDKILLCNSFAPEYLGKDRRDVMGMDIKTLFEQNEEGLFAVTGKDKICILDKTEIIDKFGDRLYKLCFFRDISEERRTFKLLQQSKEELERIYNLDPLTDIYNRRGFYQAFPELLKDKEGGFVTVLSLDMDNLKPVNDNYGHSAGDFALLSLAEAMRELAGKNGVCARFGGDEFVALFHSETELKDVQKICLQSINTKLQKIREEKKLPYPLECSVGAVQQAWFKYLDIDILLAKSDKLLYEVKLERHKERRNSAAV